MLALCGSGCRCEETADPAGDATDASDAPAPPSLEELARSGRPAVVDGEWHCQARLKLLASAAAGLQLGVRIDDIVPGDGVRQYCLRDPVSRHAAQLPKDGCDAGCRLLGESMDVDVSNGTLSRIRVHRPLRSQRFAHLTPSYRESDHGVGIGMSEAEALRLLPPPKRRASVTDPEFGEVTQLWYDGLIVELDRVDGGLIVGGMTIVPKEK